MTVLIFANGDLDNIDWVHPYLRAATAVIAADGGTNHLYRLDHLPDVVVGDLDSISYQARHWLQDAGVPLQQVSEDKDETDLELALLYAVDHYAGDILLFAAIGGRLDQTLANILLLAHPALADRRIELVTPHERAWLVTSDTEIHGEIGDTISLIPFGGHVWVQSTSGLNWPLNNEQLDFGLARGVSNTLSAPVAAVSISSGTLLCLHTRQSWSR